MEKWLKKQKILIPDKIKEWLEEVVSSRRKLSAEEKTGSLFKPTKPEAIAYITSIIVLAISFSYVKVITLIKYGRCFQFSLRQAFLLALSRNSFLSRSCEAEACGANTRFGLLGLSSFFSLLSPSRFPSLHLHVMCTNPQNSRNG